MGDEAVTTEPRSSVSIESRAKGDPKVTLKRYISDDHTEVEALVYSAKKEYDLLCSITKESPTQEGE